MIFVKAMTVILLLLAPFTFPYAYYQVLKWVVTGVTGYLAFLAYEDNKKVWVWIFGAIAILFNPIAPFYLNKGVWNVIDFVVAILILKNILQEAGFKK